MFGCTNPGQVLEEIAACKAEYPNAYIRVIGFDGDRQVCHFAPFGINFDYCASRGLILACVLLVPGTNRIFPRCKALDWLTFSALKDRHY